MSLNIQTIINEIVEENNQYKSGLRNNGKFSISDAGTCYRARIYKRMGVEPTRTIPIENLRKMVAGAAGAGPEDAAGRPAALGDQAHLVRASAQGQEIRARLPAQ